MRKRLVKFLLFLLDKLGYSPYGVTHELLEAAHQATAEAERKGSAKSGEAKRAQALRMMLNLVPDASQRQIGLAIELCLPL
jgi:hypothetical protein